MGLTEDATTLTTGIGITLNGRNTLQETIAIRQCSLVLADTDDHIGLTENIVRNSSNRFIMIANITFPTTAIDVTHRTTFYIGCCTGGKTVRIRVAFSTNFVVIIHGTTGTTSINILIHCTTQQVNICRTTDNSIGTQTSAVGIVDNRYSLMDMNVGIVFLAIQTYRMGQRAL